MSLIEKRILAAHPTHARLRSVTLPNNRRRFGARLTAATAALAFATFTAAGEWDVRLRTLFIDPANQSSPIAALAVPRDAISVSTKWTPELDVTYRFNERWSLEAIASPLLEHRVIVEQSALGRPTRIGSFKHLPPTLSLQYRFRPTHRLSPYVALGINATWISDVNLAVPGVGELDLDRWSFGPSLQAGLNWTLHDRWHLNVDAKKIWIESDVSWSGTKLASVGVDPFVYGIGLGYQFGANVPTGNR